MDDTVNSEVISVSTENKPIKARDISRAKWATIIAKCKKETKELGIPYPSGVKTTVSAKRAAGITIRSYHPNHSQGDE